MPVAVHYPDTVRAPSALLALTEVPRSLREMGMLRQAEAVLASAPDGDGHPVLVVPGFIAGDGSTAILRRFLKNHGYDAYAWELGRNLGPRAIGPAGEKLMSRLVDIHRQTGRKVSLVGWSLGGIMARLVARRLPEAVRQIISLGSPFAGNPRASNVWRPYQMLTGQKIDDAATIEQLAEVAAPPPVPSTAIYTRGDGIVAWQNCMEPAGRTTDNIEVVGSHLGLVINPAVLYAVADRLAQPEGEWRPFDRSSVAGLAYPAAA